jgi:type VI secretion system secreted protein Hcp
MPTNPIDFFMYLESNRGAIPGEAADAVFKDHIQVNRFTIDIAGPDLDAGKDTEAGQCSFQKVEIELISSVATATLLSCCCSGELLKTATIVCRKAGTTQQPYLQWRFHKVQVANYKVATSGEQPVETINLKYAKLEVCYFRQSQDGRVEEAGRMAGWDADTNTKLAATLPYDPKRK